MRFYIIKYYNVNKSDTLQLICMHNEQLIAVTDTTWADICVELHVAIKND